MPEREVSWHTKDENTIVARFAVPPERPELRLGIDERGALRSVSLDRWGNVGQREFSYIPFGVGGVGKSRLATHYVSAHPDGYDVVAWIRAEDGGVADLADPAAALGESVDGLSPTIALSGRTRSGDVVGWLCMGCRNARAHGR